MPKRKTWVDPFKIWVECNICSTAFSGRTTSDEWWPYADTANRCGQCSYEYEHLHGSLFHLRERLKERREQFAGLRPMVELYLTKKGVL